jgi:hypothetical protein
MVVPNYFIIVFLQCQLFDVDAQNNIWKEATI